MLSRLALPMTSLAALLLVVACGDSRPPEDRPGRADRVFLNGAIYTVNPGQPWAEAIAVRNGRIQYVGVNLAAESLIGPDTQVTDLAGDMILPGFHDSHSHLVAAGGGLGACDLHGIGTRDALFAAISACAADPAYGSGGWLRGFGWNVSLFPVSGPTRQQLDALIPDRPASFMSYDGHSDWVNTAGLAAAHITRDTKAPENGIIEREADGNPSGTIKNAARLLLRNLGDEEDIIAAHVAGIRAGMDYANSFGIVSIIDPGLDAHEVAAYGSLATSGALTLHVLGSLSPLSHIPGAFAWDALAPLLEDRKTHERASLSLDSVKIYIDGVIETETSLMVADYASRPGWRGEAYYDLDTLTALFRRIDARGLQIHVHAIGDGAIRLALDGFEALEQENGKADRRNHIVHLQVIRPEDQARFGALGVGATFQALWAQPDELMALGLRMTGEALRAYTYPMASVAGAGGRIIGGSDWDVSSLNPLDAIEVALTRQDPDGDGTGPVFTADERVDLATMIRAYTIEGAWLKRRDRSTGSLEVGKRADLIRLDRNLFKIDPQEINEAQVLETLYGGETVFKYQQSE